jgi:hypothetical protein
MRNRLRQTSINLLLSVLVLTWGIIPPGVQHVHAGGSDVGHQHQIDQHDADHKVGHHGSQGHKSDDGHHSDGHHHDTKTSDIRLLADYVCHIHWRLLGVEFSTPVSEKPVEGDDDGDTLGPTIVRMTSQVVTAGPASLSFGRVLLRANCAPIANVVQSLAPIRCVSKIGMSNVGTSIPLCDSARLERSGVLLA